MQVLGAADEAHRGHAEAVAVQRVLGGLDQVRVVGQAQVVVGAEIQHRAAVVQGDFRRLRAGDDAFGLEQPLRADGVQFLGVVPGEWGGVRGCGHGRVLRTERSPDFSRPPHLALASCAMAISDTPEVISPPGCAPAASTLPHVHRSRR
ncbi:hypothetical protein D3C81_1242050 [compost metagenome]